MNIRMIFLVLVIGLAAPLSAGVVELARSSGVEGGIIVHVGCGDGLETVKLLLDERYLVHGLDVDEAKVRQARENILGMGLYGRISVDRYDGKRLPYTDNLINLLIVSADEGRLLRAEILRVLTPGGVAYVGGKKLIKPRPAEIDEWTHFLHGPDNNAVASDVRADMPRSIQWVSEPRWGRSHEEMAGMSAAVSAQGRLFYIVDEAPLASIRFSGNWKLVARDAFNGVLLWKKDIPLWNDHLRHFRSGPTHLPRRLAAVGNKVYVTLGLDGPVTILNGADGKTIAVLEGTERTEEILIDDGVAYLAIGASEGKRRGGGLYERKEPGPTDFRRIVAINVETQKRLWKKEFGPDECLLPLSLAVKGSHIYYQSARGVTCLDAGDGKEIWLTPRKTPAKRMAWSTSTLVATDEVVLCADRNGEPSKDGTISYGVHGWNEPGYPRKAGGSLYAYQAKDGKELWSVRCSEGYNSPVDVFVIDGLVWIGYEYQGRDLKTGVIKKRINVKGDRVGMAHHRCYRNKASERFIFTGKSGIELLSLEEGWLGNNSWIRGTCQYGIMPCNGLLYAPPDACACFLTVKVPGFYAAAPQKGKTGHMPFPEKPVLEIGPLYGKDFNVAKVDEHDWPMYRHNPARSGAGSSPAPDVLTKKWSASIGGKLTQPVIVNDKVYVASVDRDTLYALSADKGGRELWRYTAGGRIDSSPTIYRGMALFGSADGWVYCLGAETGKLIWRFRAAPEERLVSVYGRLESVWAVHGAVLIQNDTLYVTAGRTSYTDGGIVLYRIDPATGKELSRTMLYHLDPDTGKQLTSEGGFNMEGAASDILSGDGDSVFLKQFRFGADGKRIAKTKPHLWSITGFLGEEWFVRSYWIYGEKCQAGWGGWARAANAYPSGRILCYDQDKLFGYGRIEVAGGATGHKLDTYHLFAAGINSGSDLVERVNKKGRKEKAARKAEPAWSVCQPLTVRAMSLTADKLAIAGPVDLGVKDEKILSYKNEAQALAAFVGRKDIYLRLISTVNGESLSEYKLPALPAFDGMSVANGCLFVSLKNGDVICLGK